MELIVAMLDIYTLQISVQLKWVEFKVRMEDIHSCQICHSAVWNNGAMDNASTKRETKTLLRTTCGFRSVLLAKLHTGIMTNL